MRQMITTETEIQAEVAIKINRYSVEVAKLLIEIESCSAKGQVHQRDGLAVTFDVRCLISCADKLAEAQAKLDSFVEMASVVGLEGENLKAAYAPVAVWFTTKKEI